MFVTKIVDATDPDVFAACRPVNMKLTVTEPGSFSARSLLVDLKRFWAQRTYEKLACVKHVELSRSGIMFLAQPGPSMFMNGAEVGIDQVMVVRGCESYTYRLSGSTQWSSMSLPKEDADDLFNASRLRGAAVITPPPGTLSRLRSLHAFMGRLAETNAGALANAELIHDLEDRLLAGWRGAMANQTSGTYTVARGHHKIIVNRFRAIVEAAQTDQQLYMSEISQQIGVSGRTLRLVCQEQLGVSPHQYVMLGRLRSARRALQKADPQITRVTDIAIEHGFFELGRFAVNYRHFFGEPPSVTLKAAA